LESQRIIINQILAGQFEITAEQKDVPPGLGSEVRFDEDNHIERNRKILVQKLRLVSASPKAIFHHSGLEVFLRDVGIVDPFSISNSQYEKDKKDRNNEEAGKKVKKEAGKGKK
jgi:hypothetical protein